MLAFAEKTFELILRLLETLAPIRGASAAIFKVAEFEVVIFPALRVAVAGVVAALLLPVASARGNVEPAPI